MAERTLFVLIGAGASHDCASDVLRKKSAWDLQPPLVTDLFAPRFTHVLSRYPLAQMAASTIRSHRGSSMALERFLREEFRDSSHALDRRKFHAIHFYFQDLLHEISCDYAEHPDNYDRLIEATERLPRVVYISLNYDTLLDDRLRIVDPDGLNKIDDYCNPDRSWSLLKPHGSVDWVQRLSEPPHVLGPNFAIQPPA
ncbi:MAG: hypothetical protein J7513_01245, partial [Solirubrobacteraceae bacterium]|nr:hypothetical protein [Solirubrobacteraceae bacterium]